MSTSAPYLTFSDFLARYFPRKMQKLTINAGFTCPNRDGTLGVGGCTYCNNQSFNPAYCAPTATVAEQVAVGVEFFRRKYPDMGYLAYFQTYTNTHGELHRLIDLYEQALGCDGVEGLIIGTRPDCMPEPLLSYLAAKARERFVMVEYGAESTHDRTLQLVNRCHTWADTADAVRRTHRAGIPVGLHLIMGLPGESQDDMLATIDACNELPIDVLKVHQLQLVRGTTLSRQVERGEVEICHFTVDEYLDLCCEIVARLRSDIAIERFVSQSPASLLISPRWGLKNYQFTHLLHQRLASRLASRLGSRLGR